MKRCEKVFYIMQAIIVAIVSIMLLLIIKNTISINLSATIIEGILIILLGSIASSLNISLLVKSKEH